VSLLDPTAQDTPPTARLYLTPDREEITRRRALVPKGLVVEAWPDHDQMALSWIGDQAKAALESVGPPITIALWLPAETIAIFYGPQLTELESLPTLESLRARVVSGHGIAAAWLPPEPADRGPAGEPVALADPVFPLRRVGGAVSHLWRLFRTRGEAVAYMSETYGDDSEGVEWARALPERDFEALLERHAHRD
jgi:hypothetical protein